MGAFHAYDIRGVYNKDFDKDTAYKVGYFLPETPEGYEDYDAFFINASLKGENIENVRLFWGEADMSQIKEGESINSYFTEKRDIVIYFDTETGTITKAETIENE